jgi:hypothetical protein
VAKKKDDVTLIFGGCSDDVWVVRFLSSSLNAIRIDKALYSACRV